jgi:hypothetical protein
MPIDLPGFALPLPWLLITAGLKSTSAQPCIIDFALRALMPIAAINLCCYLRRQAYTDAKGVCLSKQAIS